MMNDAFLSIVQPQGTEALTHLMVRARAKQDIGRVFPQAKVTKSKAGSRKDYAYRAILPRNVVIFAISERVAKIDYGNFKSSVKEHDRHDAYLECWHAMHDFQSMRLAEGKPRRSSLNPYPY